MLSLAIPSEERITAKQTHVKAKAQAAHKAELIAIICIGET